MADTRTINQDQIGSAVRWVASFGAGVAVGRGMISKETMAAFLTNLDTVLPTIIGLATAIWGWYIKRDAGLIQSAATVPTVRAVVVNDPAVAAAEPSQKVTTASDARNKGLV